MSLVVVKEVLSDNVVQENIPWQFSASQALQHIGELLDFSIRQNNGTLTGLIYEVINKVENIEFLFILQSNESKFFLWSFESVILF